MRMPGADERLKWWQGALVLVVVGIGAQLAGGVAMLAIVAVGMATGSTSLEELGAGHISFGVLAPTLVVTEAAMVVGAVVAALLAQIPVGKGLGFARAPWPAFVVAPIGILALGPTSDVLHRVMETYLPWLTLGGLDTLDAAARSAPVWLVAPLFALGPGIAEEVVFRGAFQRSIPIPWLAVILSGLLFAIYHTDPHHVVAVLPLGFYLAWIYQRTGSVLVSITAHVVNNGAAVIAASLTSPDEGVRGLAGLEDAWMIPVGWVVAGAAIAIIWWVTRRRDPIDREALAEVFD